VQHGGCILAAKTVGQTSNPPQLIGPPEGEGEGEGYVGMSRQHPRSQDADMIASLSAVRSSDEMEGTKHMVSCDMNGLLATRFTGLTFFIRMGSLLLLL